VELLDLKVAQSAGEHPNHVVRFSDSGDRRTLLPSQAGTKLDGGEQTRGLGGTDAGRAQQLGPRPLGQAAQRSIADLEQPERHIEHAAPLIAGSYQNCEELGRGERGSAQRPEALPWAIGIRESGERPGHGLK
jgi:hypothetical protein